MSLAHFIAIVWIMQLNIGGTTGPVWNVSIKINRFLLLAFCYHRKEIIRIIRFYVACEGSRKSLMIKSGYFLLLKSELVPRKFMTNLF